MKKILVSLAAASIVATAGMADVDFKTSGQAVVYYNTVGDNAKGTDKDANLFDNTQSSKTSANVGIQLNFDADLKNDFTFGAQVNYLTALGLEKNLVNNTMQDTNSKLDSEGIDDDIYLSKIFLAKKVGNTTVKLGRQELPKALSPLAFSEGWNVFKNTFDAALVVNTDIKDTTIVGAFVDKTNSNGFGNDMASFDNLANGAVNEAVYILTVQNKTLPMATVTATYYALGNVGTATDSAGNPSNEGVNAYWGDVAVADKSLPMGLKVGVQAGSIVPEADAANATNALGFKACVTPIKDLTVGVAYSTVDNGTLNVTNLGGVKSPLYTQMIANQTKISLHADTYLAKATYSLGDMGNISAAFSTTDDTQVKDNDSQEFDLAYTTKVAGMDILAAYVNVQTDDKATNGVDNTDVVRVVARYNF